MRNQEAKINQTDIHIKNLADEFIKDKNIHLSMNYRVERSVIDDLVEQCEKGEVAFQSALGEALGLVKTEIAGIALLYLEELPRAISREVEARKSRVPGKKRRK